MSLLQDPETTDEAIDFGSWDRPRRSRPLTAADAHRADIDLTREDGPGPRHEPDHRPVQGPVQVEPGGRIAWRGMRIQRVRLGSVATLALVFWLLASVVLLGTVAVVWNVARAFGFISEIEEVVVTSLGLDSFDIDGGALFGIAAAATAFLCTLGWMLTVLMAAVYNASCAVFGGLAVETGPLQRRRRVFSLRHRGFVTIRA